MNHTLTESLHEQDGVFIGTCQVSTSNNLLHSTVYHIHLMGVASLIQCTFSIASSPLTLNSQAHVLINQRLF